MKILKAALDLILVAYIVFAVLLLATVLNENTIFNVSSENQVLVLYKVLVGVGAGIMLLKLLVNYLYITGIRHEQHRADLKINELKADLYEKRQAFRSNSIKQPEAREAVEVDI
ncbi:hypothetical protein ACFSKU_06510 [Pontibacter silvestris]|uniref:Lipopolysaccharide assembly protein A domain-containing protein n=1 Tax=Pontibacter silvestris TaxID=2305183 RepID=A0ABW4WV65_9BACT|nr:hypothetical protein [Pontibacter silvestris]MCC9136487.1 hypothetical protein [Pontibacter silvestris]